MVARTVSSDLRILALSVIWLVVSVVPTAADDLSRYRGFQLGMSLSAVARQAGIGLEPRVLQHRPALIQELMWQPARVVGALAQPDSVRKVLFTFYNGQLFRMVISYADTRGDPAGAVAVPGRRGPRRDGALAGVSLLALPRVRRRGRGALGRCRELGASLPIVVSVHVRAGPVLEIARSPRANCDAGKRPSRRARSAATGARPPAAVIGRHPRQARNGETPEQGHLPALRSDRIRKRALRGDREDHARCVGIPSMDRTAVLPSEGS